MPTNSTPPTHSADTVLLRVASNTLETLLWQRRDEPHALRFALPGGLLERGESLEEAALRHLAAKVGAGPVAHLEQLETRSEPERDPRGWLITTAFLALARPDIRVAERADTAWYPALDPPTLAFDHAELLRIAIDRLRGKLSYSNIAFALVRPAFAISELRDVYQAVLGYEVSPTNLQRVLERDGLIEATGERRPPGRRGGRPPELHRFSHDHLTISRPYAAFAPRRTS
jgi:8-oxo-dGTP diphosphatase